MEGESYPIMLRELDRRGNENRERISVLESQRDDMRDDINRLGDTVRRETAKLDTKIESKTGELHGRLDRINRGLWVAAATFATLAGSIMIAVLRG
jgi:hypothetical protein